jgi:hypothetical protein
MKLQHWRGFQRHFDLRGAPVLDLRVASMKRSAIEDFPFLRASSYWYRVPEYAALLPGYMLLGQRDSRASTISASANWPLRSSRLKIVRLLALIVARRSRFSVLFVATSIAVLT